MLKAKDSMRVTYEYEYININLDINRQLLAPHNGRSALSPVLLPAQAARGADAVAQRIELRRAPRELREELAELRRELRTGAEHDAVLA